MTQSELPKGFATLAYGAKEEKIFEAMASENGYERKTTFFSDLSIAECYGLDSIKDTYNRVVKEWLSDVKYFAEFVISLNWKSWEWAEREGDESELGALYAELYYKANDLAWETYKDEDASYYFSVTD